MTRAALAARLSALESRKKSARPRRAARKNAPPGKTPAAPSDSEQRLRAILETAAEGIITIDDSGRIESFNRASEIMFGYKAAEVIGRNVSLLMPSPDREKHDSYLASYHRTGTAKIIGIGREVVAQRKDGSPFPVELSVSEVRLADRRLFTGFIRDITERKAAEKSLWHYAAIFESSEDAIVGKTLEGIITTWNRGAEHLFGYTGNEVIGKHISLLIPPDRPNEESSILDRIRRGESVEHYETVRQRKDGKRIDVSVTISPIRAAGGKIIGVSKVARDVTVRKKAEEQLRLLSEALESAANGIAITDTRGQILWVNPAFTQLTGYDRDEAVGKNPRILKSGKHPAELYRELWETILRGRSWHGEMVNRRKDGSLYPEEMTITPVRAGDGDITHFVAVKQDITERRRAEEKLATLAQTLAEKNKELETIVYVASHDLRSPLVNIQGFARELSQSCARLQRLAPDLKPGSSSGPAELGQLLSGEIPEALEYIQAGVAKIDSLLSGFLRYSRLGRAALKIDRLDIKAMLAGIAQAMEFQIKQAGAALQIGAVPDCLGDATQIDQVFSNLLDNAVKYLDPSRPGLISVTGRVEGGQSIYVVRDNGIGIAKGHQEKIFEIFHRLDPAHGTGEGLGLTIAQRILERHNGRIRVESEPAAGTAFFVSLPAPAQAISANENGT
jgi:PAS domain S-box-containing protein